MQYLDVIHDKDEDMPSTHARWYRHWLVGCLEVWITRFHGGASHCEKRHPAVTRMCLDAANAMCPPSALLDAAAVTATRTRCTPTQRTAGAPAGARQARPPHASLHSHVTKDGMPSTFDASAPPPASQNPLNPQSHRRHLALQPPRPLRRRGRCCPPNWLPRQ